MVALKLLICLWILFCGNLANYLNPFKIEKQISERSKDLKPWLCIIHVLYVPVWLWVLRANAFTSEWFNTLYNVKHGLIHFCTFKGEDIKLMSTSDEQVSKLLCKYGLSYFFFFQIFCRGNSYLKMFIACWVFGTTLLSDKI